MSDIIIPPKEIEDAIGLNAWSALSWALHCGWVQDYKYLFSEIKEHDIGVPETVIHLLQLCNLMQRTGKFYTFNEELGREEYEKVGSRGLFMFIDRVEAYKIQRFYELLVEGYLCGTDFVSDIPPVPDENGNNQLEGELRRFLMRMDNLPISEIANIFAQPIWAVNRYCGYYGLPESCKKHMIAKLEQE